MKYGIIKVINGNYFVSSWMWWKDTKNSSIILLLLLSSRKDKKHDSVVVVDPGGFRRGLRRNYVSGNSIGKQGEMIRLENKHGK